MEAYIPKRKTDVPAPLPVLVTPEKAIKKDEKKAHFKTRVLLLAGALLTIPLFTYAYSFTHTNSDNRNVGIAQNQTTTGPIIYSVCPSYGCGRTAQVRQVNSATNVYGEGYTQNYVQPETKYVNTYPTSNIQNTSYTTDGTRAKGSPAWSNGEWTVESPSNYAASLDQPIRQHGSPAW